MKEAMTNDYMIRHEGMLLDHRLSAGFTPTLFIRRSLDEQIENSKAKAHVQGI